ncbi:hypothetical protein ID866_5755 [Astraeus odoratus]|nr:hypothetical protein ID866_5755 [Astraeus odoratus]
MALLRPRRILLLTLLFSAFLGFYLFSCLSSDDDGYVSTSAPDGATVPDEIFGLLWFVAAPEEQGRTLVVHSGEDTGKVDAKLAMSEPVNPEKPIDMTWYALGSIAAQGKSRGRGRLHDVDGSARRSEDVPRRWGKPLAKSNGGWMERIHVLRKEYPLIVFSKVGSVTYLQWTAMNPTSLLDPELLYSARAKAILERYDITPRPKIIEVDLRVTTAPSLPTSDIADAPHIKTLLTRLTHHTTFPNIILHGHSLGGSDDLGRMHEEGLLHSVFEAAGLKVGWDGEYERGEVMV